MAALPKSEKFVLNSTLRMGCTIFLAILSVFQITVVSAIPEDPLITYDMLYTSGIQAYNSKRWFECGSFLLRALEDYKNYREDLIACRLKCRTQSKTDIDSSKHIDLAFYDLSLKRSNCLRRCKKAAFGHRPEMVNEKIDRDFENLEPYNYLQLCAYKTGLFEHAVSAAFTYLHAHPDHEMMRNNMVYYRSMSEAKPEFFKDLEARQYQVLYQDGVQAYADEEYIKVVDAIEDALVHYYRDMDKCSALCEGPFDHESLPDQVNAIADHYISTLQCELECPKKLATFMGKEIEDYLPEHYNYLQFSYFKLGNLDKACQAVGSFLLFSPHNEEMVTNKQYYMAQDGIYEHSFEPTQDAADYVLRRKYLEAQMDYVRKQYKFSDADLDRIGLENKKRKKMRQVKEHPKPEYGPLDEVYEERMAEYRRQGINVSLTDKDLEGDHRVAVDGLITEKQCQQLMDLAKVGASQGDGYMNSKARSPHTTHEKFEGITVVKAAQLAREGVITEELAELYLKISNRAKLFSEHYWNLQTPLYFHYTHLVCRTALDGQNLRKDLSHPIHADNCILNRESGTCLRRAPAYTERDFSALLYLNGDFEGGDFFFAHRNLSVHKKLHPKCGRMVAFEAGHYHGVEAVKKGRRCAVALWFTLSEYDAETNRREAESILRSLSVMKKMENDLLRNLLEKHDIRIIRTENELDGPERFAADGLVTKSECDKLIQLANEGGQVGDGYMSTRTSQQLSPHTRHEKFAALTVKKAAEAGGLEGDGYKTKGKQGSPHTSHEMFEGLTIIRATQLAAAGKVDVEAVELYLEIAEKGRHLTATYFNLKTPLYFDFTHLVCRTALGDEGTLRTDLSHPVHSDNCILQNDGTCLRQAPAYVQRDYSAIIYLNGDFRGGEFFFAHPNRTVQNELKPKAGMMVSFNASNLHGVKAVKKGQRCAIALWFTLNKKFKERAHLIAKKVVEDVRERRRHRHSEL